MALFRHLAQIPMPAAFDEYQFCIGYFVGEHFGRYNMATSAALMSVFAADNDNVGALILSIKCVVSWHWRATTWRR